MHFVALEDTNVSGAETPELLSEAGKRKSSEVPDAP